MQNFWRLLNLAQLTPRESENTYATQIRPSWKNSSIDLKKLRAVFKNLRGSRQTENRSFKMDSVD